MLNYPFSIFLYQSEQMIKILNIPFYEDSRIWQTKARLSTSALSSCSPWSLQWTRIATTSSCLCVPKDEENDLPILIDGNVTITRSKVIIMNILTGNNLFIPLFRRPCLISCETLSVKLPLAPFEFKYNLLINCSSIIDLDHWRELFTKQSQLKSSILKSADKRILKF